MEFIITKEAPKVNLTESDLRKREAWAAREGVESYVQQMGNYALRRDEEIIREMLEGKSGILLDMPCGTGRYFALEKELGFKIVAADYSPTMLSVAKKHEDIEFVQADAYDPPFAPETFDVILISRLLFHYANPERIIKSLLPSLKPNGRMIFDTLNTFSSRWFASLVLRCIRRDPARRIYFERCSTMTRKLETLGLKVLRRKSAYALPTRLYRFLPRWTISTTDIIEKAIPPVLRVLSYWQVTRQ